MGPEIELLRSFGIPASRISNLLDESAANIRQISRRAQFPKQRPLEIPAPPVREAQLEEFWLYGKRRKALEALEWEVEDIFNHYASAYQFEEGADVLMGLLELVSAPTNPRRVRLRARIHHHIAWFKVQQGKAKSAFDHGQFSMWLSRQAYKDSWDILDLNRYVETALIVSMAAHLSAEGQDRSEAHALFVLWLAKEAAETAKNPRGSEHFRQRGSAYFHLGYEDEARANFLKAIQKAREKGEARDENHALMIGNRFLNLLGKTPNWDGAQELLSKVSDTFGKHSLEYAINVNYASAAGFLTNDSTNKQEVLKLLLSNASLIEPFGRQATVLRLLSITPDLKLAPAEQSRWIKQVLRANALRNL
jgi:tetratricopeptide (TPR) repeat protein